MPPKKENHISTNTTTGLSAASAADTTAAEQKQALYLANAKLCRLVKRCPWMYDRQHPNYAKKQFVDKSWTKIAKDCDDSVASCKERWRNIRAAFARSINIYKTSSGPNRVKPYYLYNDLQFLIKPMMDGRERASKDVDDIKADWDSASAAVSPEKARENLTSSENAEGQPEPMVEVQEADLDFASIDMEGSECEPPSNFMETHDATPAAANDSNVSTTCKRGEGGRHSGDHDHDHDHDHSTAGAPPPPPPPPPPPHAKRLRSSNDAGNVSVGVSRSPHDADAKFLEALLPDMRAMNTRQKIIFKRKIYQSLEEVFETSTDFPKFTTATATSTSTPMPMPTPRPVAAPRRDHAHQPHATQNLLHSIANLKESDLQKLQEFLQNLLRQTSATSAEITANQRHPNGGQPLTVVPMPCGQYQNHSRGVPQSGHSAGTGAAWEQLQPMTVKYELLEDDGDDDVHDFE